MNKLKTFIKILFVFLFVLISAKGFCEDWYPRREFIDGKSEKNMLLKIINKEPITYCVDEEIPNTPSEVSPTSTVVVSGAGMSVKNIYDVPVDVEFAMERWFKNVLKRAKKYPNFEETFADIIAILKNPARMKEIKCGPHPQEYIFSNFKTQDKNFVPGEEIEDVRIVFSSRETLHSVPLEKKLDPGAAGFYKPLSDRKLIWVSKKDALFERYVLSHEFGHLLGFADVSYDQERQAKEYGSESEKTIMAQGYNSLTCDDADGLIALLYLGMDKSKTFNSFCDSRIIYSDGKKIDLNQLSTAKMKDLLQINELTIKDFSH